MVHGRSNQIVLYQFAELHYQSISLVFIDDKAYWDLSVAMDLNVIEINCV